MTNPYAPPSAVVADVGDMIGAAVPADRAVRLGAAILDGIIFAILVYTPLIVGAVLAGASAGFANQGDTPVTAADLSPYFMVAFLFGGIGFLVWLGLTLYFLNQNRQSIAKKLVGIKLVRADGSTVSMSRVIFLRNILNGIIGFVPLYGIVDILFIFSDNRQCLHDKLADTIVVKA